MRYSGVAALRQLCRAVHTGGRRPGGETSAQNHCLDLVRRYDKENFLCTLLLANPQRRSALAVRAFNVEIARITGTVTDDKIGLMRLKFWEDAVAKLYRGEGDGPAQAVPEQPVIGELARAVAAHRLTKRYLHRLVSARTNANLLFVTTQQLEEYVEQSVSSVYYLLLEVHGVRNLQADHAASHLGKAHGIVNLLRSIPHQERRRVLPVPHELLMRHGVSAERVLRNRPDDKGVEEVVFELATLAHQHLEKARALAGSVPVAAKAALLPGIAVGRYLERLRRARFHLTDARMLRSDTLLPLVLYWNYRLRRF